MDEYWLKAAVIEGLKSGKLVEGSFRVNQHRRTEAYATVAGMEVDILIDNLADQNRAFEGDTVAILLDPPEKWKKMPVSADAAVEKVSSDEEDEEEDDEVADDVLDHHLAALESQPVEIKKTVVDVASAPATPPPSDDV